MRHSVVFWLSEMNSVKHTVRITATKTNERMLTAAGGIDVNLLPRKCHTLDTLHREKERMCGYLGGRVFDSSAGGRPTTRRKDSVRFWTIDSSSDSSWVRQHTTADGQRKRPSTLPCSHCCTREPLVQRV